MHQEETMQNTTKRNKLTFLSSKGNDMSGVYNKKVLAEMEATIAGFTPDEIKYMTDPKNEGSEKLMSECAEDIQRMLKGEVILTNDMANTAYMQKMKDYMRDNQEYFIKHPDIANNMFNYMERLQPIVIRNMTVDINTQLASEGIPTLQGQAQGMSGQAVVGGADNGSVAPTNATQQSTLQNYGK